MACLNIIGNSICKLWRTVCIVVAGTLVYASVTGCQPLGYEQMTNVAKDWSWSMRANQLIPVYPLTEDLQPGDVFLVQRSIADQQEDYKKKGFLHLDDHRHRFPLGAVVNGATQYSGLTDLYFDGYFKDEFGSAVPHPRPARLANAGAVTTQPAPVFNEIPAPRVAFPTYTFEVDRGGGLSLAVPIHAVPVAFNYMGADKAVGTVALLDTHTYAADTYYLDEQLRKWAAGPEIAASLKDAVNFGDPKHPRPAYLRVVSRVYLAGGVSVTLTRADSGGGDLTAGNVKEIGSLSQQSSASSNYADLLAKLSDQANNGTAVGGSVKFTQASTMGVSLNETFDHPLAVGYLGFDIAILPDGTLGPRVPTFDVLEGKQTPAVIPAQTYTHDEQLNAVEHAAFRDLGSQPAGDIKTLMVIASMGSKLNRAPFIDLGNKASALVSATTRPTDFATQFNLLKTKFMNQWDLFVSLDGGDGPNYRAFTDAFGQSFLGQ